jgi:hypothetical protein
MVKLVGSMKHNATIEVAEILLKKELFSYARLKKEFDT